MYFEVYSSSFLPFLVVFAVQCSAKFLLETIPTLPELSQLQSYIEKLPSLLAELEKADNYTLLAPTNDAFDSWLSEATPQPSLDDIEATLYYHLLHGIYPISSFASSPQFVSSFLTNISYTNVTTGQAVQLFLDNRKLPWIGSGNLTNTSIITTDVVATGGIIQIVSSILQVPRREPIVVRDAKLSFFVGLLTKGGFLSTNRDAFTTELTNLPNTVYFAPNTAEALSQFSNISVTSADQLSDLLKYHVVTDRLLYSADLKDGMNLTSLQGTNLTIRIGKDGIKFVNGARILETDFLVANGVLHTIDGLLDPANITSPFPVASYSGLSDTLIAAIVISVFMCVLLLGGGALWGFRRRGANLPFLKERTKISYPLYSQNHHELGSQTNLERSIWPGDRGSSFYKTTTVDVQAVELDTGRANGQTWELEGGEKGSKDGQSRRIWR